jgi:hypothetical protein
MPPFGPVEDAPDTSLNPYYDPETGRLRITVAPGAPPGSDAGGYAGALAPFMGTAPPEMSPTETTAQQYMAPTRANVGPRYISPAIVDDAGNVAYEDPQRGTTYTDNTRHEVQQDAQGRYHVYEKAPPVDWGPVPRTAPPASARRVGPQPAPQSLWEQGIPQTIGAVAAAPFELPPPGPPESYVPWGVKTFLNAATGGLPGLERSALGAFGGRGFHLPPFEPNPRAVMGGNMPPAQYRLEPVEGVPQMEPGRTVQLVPHEGPTPLWMHEIPGELPEQPQVPLGHAPGEHELSSVPILSEETLPRPARSSNVWDIAKMLHNRGSAALKKMGFESGKITPETATPEASEMLARNIAYETKAAMDRSGHAGDWYTSGVSEAVKIASLVHPEIRTDLHARKAFLAAKAITSQNEKVGQNVRLANQAYEYFKQNGRFPTDVVANKADMMNGNFEKLNQLLADHGPDKTWEFMNRQWIVRDLEQALGHKIQGAAKDDIVYGSAILGPKIGNGFFQNLSGNFNPVTFDLWWMRTWGRMTGTLSGKPENLPKAVERFQKALRAEGRPVPFNQQGLDKLSEAIWAQHERDFVKYRDEFKAGTRSKSELTLAAERLQHNLHGVNEQPTSASHRRWMTGVVNRARELLANEGHTLTNADIQALMWYPEKDIYSKLGSAASTEELNVNYSQAWRNVLKSRGWTDERINTAIRAME